MVGGTFQSFRKHLFTRLLTMYHIVILPIIILGIYLYIWSYNYASEEISRHTESQLKVYLENLNRELTWMETQQYNLLQDNELQTVALTWDLMNNVERKESMQYLFDRLMTIKTTSAYIEDIFIHIRSIDRSVSALGHVQNYNADYYTSIYSELMEDTYLINVIDDSLRLIVGNMNRDTDGLPFFFVEIMLDKDKLENSLDSINLYENNGFFLLSNEEDLLWQSSEASEDILIEYLSTMGLNEQENKRMLTIGDEKYQFNQAYDEMRNFTVISYLPEEEVERPLGIFRNWVWLFGLFVIFAIIIYAYSTYRLVHRPLVVLVDAFRRIEKGDLNQPIQHNNEGEFGYLYNRFNKMIGRLKVLIDRNYKQTLMVQKAELKQLQSQINPHFLYNSFFILNSLAQTEDISRLEQFTQMLGEYYKFITRTDENTIDLKNEVKHARMYTDIQNMRFSRRIKVEFQELPEELNQIKVPKLIVQPIIENAYKYSLEDKTEAGLLSVTFTSTENEVEIIIEDNGEKLTKEEIEKLEERIKNPKKAQEITGLINIHRRLVLSFASGSGLYLSQSDLGGLKVKVRLVCKEDYKHVSLTNSR
ncbi:HAMP domain-containing protein [Gracilibacillus salitolerans]|uniref:HAMP domain-containing protein n=1 Tax=Gracilibacillus salitolerans TaxID=2663022 RepID=A0A5Q2TFR4_9BACI|nr:histidine kinase [Gracilibacillus salitolerans]QGH33496.1 HAMP domain-containing protein [Gracilibacillus salitolerans]